MMETVVLHMLQGWLQYVEELISWVRQLLLIFGGWIPGWYVVEDDNDFRWRRMEGPAVLMPTLRLEGRQRRSEP